MGSRVDCQLAVFPFRRIYVDVIKVEYWELYNPELAALEQEVEGRNSKPSYTFSFLSNPFLLLYSVPFSSIMPRSQLLGLSWLSFSLAQ